MNMADKRKAALSALENHARRYQVTIPDRLRAFYAGDFEQYHLRFATAEPTGWGNTTFQVALTPPTWLNKDDDAMNGPDGEWEDAKHYVPLFVTDQALYAVANLQQPDCPVGWYNEENWSEGPSEGAPTLDAFLAALTPAATSSDPDEVSTPADPDQDSDWAEDFGDDGARAFDADHSSDDE